jgi:opacity protein-like surface antigen
MIRKLGLGFVSAVALASAANAADLSGGYKAPQPVWVSSDILSANNQAGIAFATTNFDYLETVSGAKFDSEGGWVPGVNVSLSLMNNMLVNNFYFRADYTHLDGKTDYVGGYNETPTSPATPYGSVKAKSPAVVDDIDFRFGKGFELSRNFMATPYLGAGYHDWQRNVGYQEEYTNGYVGAGLMLQWSPINRFVLSANGLVGTTFDSHIVTGGSLPIDVALGESTIYRVGLSGDYALTRSIHVNAGVEYVDFAYGKSAVTVFSDGQHNYYVNEPDSTTKNTTVKVGVGYSFGGGYEPLK